MATMKCILTGRDVDYKDGESSVSYNLKIGEKSVEIFICRNCKNKISSNHPSYLIDSLIANGKWPQRTFLVSEECTCKVPPVNSESIILAEFFNTVNYPKSPSEKMEHLFLNLVKRQNEDGQIFPLEICNSEFWIENYFKSPDECIFYLKGLNESGLIKLSTLGTLKYLYNIQLTHLGLNKSVELLSKGENSKECFIALAFIEEMNPFREAIKKALCKAGYIPIIIDETHLDSDKTIPDGILSGIKRAKFCIADFTHHRNGVYFESGYALGLGKSVIYLCRKDEFEKTHFDIKQLQHIIYTTPEELTTKLIDKIDVWIK